jgi:hypothetical protein
MAATSPRDRLLRALLLAAGPAVALSAYACDDGPSAGEGADNALATAGSAGSGAGGSASSVAGSGGAAGTLGIAGSGGAVASVFPPVPQGTGGSESGYPQCGPDQSSPGGFGFHGSCCVDLYCIPFVDGACPAASTVQRGTGSGTCGCETTTGPFDPGGATPVADSKGKDCCYLAGRIGCDGRPLLIAGVARVAGLAAGSAWS